MGTAAKIGVPIEGSSCQIWWVMMKCGAAGLRTLGSMTVSVLLVSILSCSTPDAYKIGFLGTLTGGVSEISIAARNGVILAIEEMNRKGGISGRRVELLIMDDKGDPENVMRSMEYFADERVVGVVGPVTAEMARVAAPLAELKKMAMISPTANSVDFPDRGDFFYRVSPADRSEAQMLAELAFQTRGYRSISILYDLTNREFAENRVRYFSAFIEALGGSIVQTTSYTTRDDTDFGLLATQVSEGNPDAVYILVSTSDLAHICRQLKKQGHDTPVLTNGWSVTLELIRQAGAAVEGLEFFQTYDLDSTVEVYQNFLKNYENRFHREPAYGALYGYESAKVVLSGLEQLKKKKTLGQVIREISVFQGLQDTIAFNRQGAAERALSHKMIENGSIITSGGG